MQIVALYISPGHNFFGHHEKPPGENPILAVDQVECVAGKGLRGDRFFGFKEDYKGQITFFSEEVYLALSQELGKFDRPHSVFRRNVIVRGVDLNGLIGQEFMIQGIRFEGMSECAPCYWMDQAFAPGAEEFLKGRGGLRARILSDGVLQREA